MGSQVGLKKHHYELVEVMEFQLNYFKSWKMMLWECCTQCASKFGKLSSGHRIGKGQFSFQFQSKAMPKNVHTIAQLHSSTCWQSNAQNSPSQASTVCELWTSRCQTRFRKGRATKLPTSTGSSKKQEFQKKHLFLLYWLCQSLWLCESQQMVENSSRDGNTRPPDLPPEKSVCRSKSNS